ncbi:hypothetical protein [Oribacterium sp. NK2B42]|uniref:hypothetical protein n=1 Tax=Oribacterium sp. NK2B42 TaxID=689781 RepID=UPI00041BE594|nr:hypothetical protein [Oribacterium sp. NK2B42]
MKQKHHKDNTLVFFVMLIVSGILSFLIVCRPFQKQESSTAVTYSEFKELASDQKEEEFSNLTGQEIYDLVKNSDENWPVTAYDLIPPRNAKWTIVLFDNNGDLHFSLAWPHYGGFLPESIASIKELSGTVDVSRDGGDGGYSMSYGRNKDGSYPDDSQRSVPKSSATVRTGTLDIDKYKEVVEIVVSENSEEERLAALTDMDYKEDIAARFIADQTAWLTRDEVAGPDNISDGAASVGHEVESSYGYYGVTAPWKAGDLDLCGGAGQINTVFSWGTLCDSGLIYDIGEAEIKIANK